MTTSLRISRIRRTARAGGLVRHRARADATQPPAALRRRSRRRSCCAAARSSRSTRRSRRHRRWRCSGDTIVALGSNQEIQPYIGAGTRVIDLKGALAVPGLIDAHVHFTGVGEAARNLKLGTAKNWDEIVRMVGDAAKKAKPGEWIIGRGWHQEKWSEVPTANVEGFPVHEALIARVAGQPGLADARQRPCRLRQRPGDEDRRGDAGPRPIPTAARSCATRTATPPG